MLAMRNIIFIHLLFVLITSHAQAQDITQQNNQAQELQKKLQQRDQVILELLERVETLEKELGVKPERSNRAATADTATKIKGEIETTNNSAPGLVVADESMAERALERSLTRDGMLLLSSGVIEIEPRLTYARQEDVTPSFVMSAAGVLASETERNSDSLTASVLFRFGLPGDSQLEIGLPYRYRRNETVTSIGFTPNQASNQSGNAAGDVRITLAKTFLREASGQPDVIGRLTWDTDTGEMSDNSVSLGGGFDEVQGSLTFIKRQDPVVFVGGLSYEHTFEKELLQPGATIAANFGSYIALNPQTSMNFLLSMALQNETRIAGNPLQGSERTIGTLLIGGSTLIARGTLLNLSVGIGLTDDADDFSVSLSLPIRI